MTAIDYAIVVAYLVGLVAAGLIHRARRDESAASFIIGGRTLTLPAFVASLVSTWYGGILGVGEYSYLYGLSTWLVFGLPYYIAALIFAIFLARKARESEALTIPDRLEKTYDKRAAGIGSVILFIMTVPAAYVLMIGILAEVLFGWPLWVGIVAGTLFSLIYVHFGGFRSVVRTDILQFGLMFIGFAVLLIVAVTEFGGLGYLRSHAPADHFTWNGGNSGWYVAVWYVIAMATLIEPSFYQRCFAVRKVSTARNGILISIGCWAVFDFMTTSCGIYARAAIPQLENPMSSFPELASLILPAGLLGVFMVALLATVMSTIDSYSFIAASTFGRDIVWRFFGVPDGRITYWTRWGLLLSTVLSVAAALFFDSIIDIWHHFGSVGTPALLVPLFTSYVGKRRMSPEWTAVSMICSGLLSLVWLLSKSLMVSGEYWFGLEPIFPGLVLSLLVFMFRARSIE
ncbi:MAG: sodium:solute symporter family protein [candidate division Zixibacteria bacterium]|nr:sodium:solute symporter family protein [candidate division Zixibacteria bacterium]MBU1471017.1 sodium:solute symporter family protein [candidate division Zixibacteria bacterium]MBU2625052.1 sodium:solute symporter family protein [candidate division Zixibacteria bacterium]